MGSVLLGKQNGKRAEAMHTQGGDSSLTGQVRLNEDISRHDGLSQWALWTRSVSHREIK